MSYDAKHYEDEYAIMRMVLEMREIPAEAREKLTQRIDDAVAELSTVTLDDAYDALSARTQLSFYLLTKSYPLAPELRENLDAQRPNLEALQVVATDVARRKMPEHVGNALNLILIRVTYMLMLIRDPVSADAAEAMAQVVAVQTLAEQHLPMEVN